MDDNKSAYRLRPRLALKGKTGTEYDRQLRKVEPLGGFVSRVSEQSPIRLSMTRHNVSAHIE